MAGLKVRRVETQTSRTAEMTCLARSISYLEDRPKYKSDDSISTIVMNSLVKQLLRFGFTRRKLLSIFPAGMYEYIVARTKYIDRGCRRAMADGVHQTIIFGAGFDTRGIRIAELTDNASVFELDAPVTQAAKVKRYKQMSVRIPQNLIFVPVDFEKDSITERLVENGFRAGKSCLFILEGLTMYLQPSSIDATFCVIDDLSGPNSIIIFDYIYASVLRRENLYEGEAELVSSVSKSNESFLFGIEKGAIDEFLRAYRYEAEEVMDSDALQKLCFSDDKGDTVAKVNGTHCIVTARRKG